MSKLKHYHAIPAILRGYNMGRAPILIDTPHGKIEEGCFNRITTVFSDPDTSIEELNRKKDALGQEYVAHMLLAEEAINKAKEARRPPALPPAKTAFTQLDAAFEKFLAGDRKELQVLAQDGANKARLRHYINAKVVSVSPGEIVIKRDNDGGMVTLDYNLKTKIKVGDHVFLRDDGKKPVPEVQAVWVNVKDAAIRAGLLRQFF